MQSKSYIILFIAFLFFLVLLEYSDLSSKMEVENEIIKMKTAIHLLKQEDNINQNTQEIVEKKEEPNYYAIGFAEVKKKFIKNHLIK